MATNTLYQVTADEEEYARLTSIMKGELDWRSGMRDAKCEGHKEGRDEGHREGLKEDRSEGRNEASLDIALNLKRMGSSIFQIAEGTGLSTETIAQL